MEQVFTEDIKQFSAPDVQITTVISILQVIPISLPCLKWTYLTVEGSVLAMRGTLVFSCGLKLIS